MLTRPSPATTAKEAKLQEIIGVCTFCTKILTKGDVVFVLPISHEKPVGVLICRNCIIDQSIKN